MTSSNEYMRTYVLNRYRSRRKEAKKHLGGKCVVCGAKKNLEFDHINPQDKTFEISKLWSCAKKKFWEEINKCQLLCKLHHREKTARDLGKPLARGTHGTVSSYRYCKCEICREAARIYLRGYRKRKFASVIQLVEG